MRVPSGDQRGDRKLRTSERNGRWLLPSALIIHRLRRTRSVMMSWLARTYTMRLPSGDTCTSSAYSSWNTSRECRRRASGSEAAWAVAKRIEPSAANRSCFMQLMYPSRRSAGQLRHLDKDSDWRGCQPVSFALSDIFALSTFDTGQPDLV